MKTIMIRLRGCPMVCSKMRKDSKCHECKESILKGQEAFRSLLNGDEGGINRAMRVCVKCGEKVPADCKIRN